MVERGTLEQFDEFFKQIRSPARLPFLTVAGNHDLGKNQDLTLYREIFGPDYYAFQLGDHYFIVLNDNLHTGMGEAQMAWLESELSKSQSYKTRLVFLHVPLFDPRGGENHHCLPEATGRQLAALFRQYRVTHIFRRPYPQLLFRQLGRRPLYHHRRGRGHVLWHRSRPFFLSLPQGHPPRGRGSRRGAADQSGRGSLAYDRISC